MVDEPDNLTLQYLRRIETRIDRMGDDLHDIKIRLTAGDEGLVGTDARLGRVELRVERIERRLDLVELPH